MEKDEKVFRTESCAECSHFAFEELETPTCFELEMITDHCSSPLTSREALEYYDPNNPSGICERYDGPIPHTLEEIQDYISKH